MKTLKTILLSVLLSHVCMGITLSFNENNPPNTVEFFIEYKNGNQWLEYAGAKSASSPIVINTLTPGLWTFRCRARNSAGVSDPSNEVTHNELLKRPNAPTNATITMLIREDGSIYNNRFNPPIDFTKIRKEFMKEKILNS